MPSYPAPKTNKICKTPGCGKPLVARGFCVACYYREIRHGNIIPRSQTTRWKHRLIDIDITERTAFCIECNERVKVFPRDHNGNRFRCSVDSNFRAKLYKQAYRKSKKSMMKDFCEICGSKDDLVWDHNHKDGKFRGTVCSRCNKALGFFKDDTRIIKSAIKYLERNK